MNGANNGEWYKVLKAHERSKWGDAIGLAGVALGTYTLALAVSYLVWLALGAA